MGFWGNVGNAIKTGIENGAALLTSTGKAIANGISKVCGVAGAGLQTIGNEATNIVCTVEKSIPVNLSTVKSVARGIEMVGGLVGGIAEAIRIKDPGKHEPMEIGMKAETCGKDPSGFISALDYLQYLRENVHIDEKAKIGLNFEMMAAYMAVGAHIYISAIEEKLGMKNGTLSPEALVDYVKLNLTPAEIVTQAKELSAEGIGTKEMSDYLHGTTTRDVTEKVDNALERAFRYDDPEMTNDDIAEKILEMRDTVAEDLSINDEEEEE